MLLPDFFWTVRHIFPETLFLIGALLAIFFALDSWYYHRREELLKTDPTPDSRSIGFDGKVNFVVLDAERDENQKLVGLFRVDAIPHFAFISPDRKLLTTLTGFVILSARVIFYACMCISSYAHSLRHACKRMLVKLSARSAAHELTYGLGCSCASVCALDMCRQKQWQRN